MLVKISLIISLICGGCSIWFSHDENKGVQGRKNKVEKDRAEAFTNRDKAIEDRKKKVIERDDEFEILRSTTNELHGVEQDIASKESQIAEINKTIQRYGMQQKAFEEFKTCPLVFSHDVLLA